MDWKKLLSQDSSIAEECFSASMVKQGKGIPSTKKYSQREWSERPGSSLESGGFPSWQKLSKSRWCLKPKVTFFLSIRFKKACPKMGYSHPTSFFIPSDMKRFLIWWSPDIKVGKPPQRSFFPRCGQTTPEVVFFPRGLRTQMYYGKIFCVYTSERALSIVAGRDYFAIDRKGF